MEKYIVLLFVLFTQAAYAQSNCGVPKMYITAEYDEHGKLIPRNYPIVLTAINCMTPTEYKKWKRKRKPVRIVCRNSFNQHQLDSLKQIDARIDSFLERQNKKK
jgi:hypothetical protein